MNNNFAFNLKHIRQSKGMTQEQLGKLMGKDYSTIGKWENGTRSPIMEDLIKLSDILNVDIKDLVNKDYNPQETANEDWEESKKKLLDSDDFEFDEIEKFFSKNKDKLKDILTDDDKEMLKFILQKRFREIDKQLDSQLENK